MYLEKILSNAKSRELTEENRAIKLNNLIYKIHKELEEISLMPIPRLQKNREAFCTHLETFLHIQSSRATRLISKDHAENPCSDSEDALDILLTTLEHIVRTFQADILLYNISQELHYFNDNEKNSTIRSIEDLMRTTITQDSDEPSDDSEYLEHYRLIGQLQAELNLLERANFLQSTLQGKKTQYKENHPRVQA